MRASPTQHKYNQIADHFERLIHKNVFKVGSKLPSVRSVSVKYGVNPGTVFQAYYSLESKGLVEAKPKSGYYVRFNRRRLPESTITHTREVPEAGNASEILATMFHNLSFKDFVNFSTASPDMNLLPALKLKKIIHQTLKSGNPGIEYPPLQGSPDLRNQIARICVPWSKDVDPDHIVTTSGCIEALRLCLNAVTQPGDTVAVQHPAYFGFFQLLSSLRLNAVEVNVNDKDFNEEQLMNIVKKFSLKALLLVTNFNNPDGNTLTTAQKKKLVQLVTKMQVPLIEDDVYGDLYFTARRPSTCKSFDKEGWVMYCNSFSKTLAPGYRVGWCLPGRFLDQVIQFKLSTAISGVALTELAIAKFLENGRYDYHLQKMRTALNVQYLRYLRDIIEYFPEKIRISRPAGGFVVWIQLPEGVDACKLYNRAIEFGVLIAPGQIFSFSNRFSNFIRLSFAKAHNENVATALRRVGSILHQMIN
jgi:DNA-binding transcriptional MocR family regulator